MSLVIHRQLLSSNYDPIELSVGFLILHYTSCGLEKSLDLFKNPHSKTSSHLVIAPDGLVYELVPCLRGKCFKAWHAGESYQLEKGETLKEFNNFSIGVELVNLNGNLFDYSPEQYQALNLLLDQLKNHYPALKNPQSVLGHEHIAGHRGKVDPGVCFDWGRFFKMNYPEELPPSRKATLSKERRDFFLKQASNCKTDEDWMELNLQMEEGNLV